MNCWHCQTQLIWGGDHETDESDEDHLIVTNLSCPNCKAICLFYWGSKEPEKPGITLSPANQILKIQILKIDQE